MKKIFTLFLASFLLTGCMFGWGRVQVEIPTQEGLEEIIEIDSETYFEMIESQETFLIYFYSQSCGGCLIFTPILEEFIKSENMMIYNIDVGEEDLSNDQRTAYTPGIFAFEKGEKVIKIDDMEDSDYFRSKEGFEGFIDRHIILR